MTDDELDSLIEASSGFWVEDEFRANCRELTALLRSVEHNALKRARAVCEREREEAMKKKLYEIGSGAWICGEAIKCLIVDAQSKDTEGA